MVKRQHLHHAVVKIQIYTMLWRKDNIYTMP